MNGVIHMTEAKQNKHPRKGEVWYALFPFEDELVLKPRPVIVLQENDEDIGVLSVKVTKHEPRDKFDYRIFYWKEAKLKMKSTARISKSMYLPIDMFERKKGDLHPSDLDTVEKLFHDYVLEQYTEQRVASDSETPSI